MPSLDPMTLDQLLTMMYNINPYVEVFKMARDMMATEGVPMDLKLRLITFRTSWPVSAHFRTTCGIHGSTLSVAISLR
jgi:hypothetical protein